MLEDCLESVTWADEIVVLDSGSTDRTLEIARRYTEHVHVSDDWRGFGVQRQRLHELCTGDWVLMVDADERVTPELRAELEALREVDEPCTAYGVLIQTHVFGEPLRWGRWCATSERLYPRRKSRFDEGRLVHETMIHDPDVGQAKTRGRLTHFPYRDLEHYLVKSARYAALFAEQRVARGQSTTLFAAVGHALALFVKMYVLRGGVLDGRRGFLMAVLSTHSTFAKYADLWSRTRALRR